MDRSKRRGAHREGSYATAAGVVKRKSRAPKQPLNVRTPKLNHHVQVVLAVTAC